MGLVIGFIVLALVLGVLGIIARAVRWLLIIGAVLFVVSLVRGAAARTTT